MVIPLLLAAAMHFFSAQFQATAIPEICFSETLTLVENGDSIINPFQQNYQAPTDSIPELLTKQLQSPF